MLVDSHCHLDFDTLAEDRAAVLDRAWQAGIETIVTICTRISRFDDIAAIAAEHERIYCSVGVHPHNADDEGIGNAAQLIEKTENSKVVGIGETGLDYFYTNSRPETQRASFLAHIAAARETGLPLIVHTRDADAETMEILTAEQAKGGFPGVIHCFTGSRALAERAIELGLYVSFLRHRHLQEGGRPAGHRPRPARGPDPGRDRRAVPGAGRRIAARPTSRPSSFTRRNASQPCEMCRWSV